ncbi:hypothetical protein GFS31_00400 [Leptolyngbya sp. BL0902]|uniref:DUF5357 family protein n=1 Tax=Leptolyngbya sp. BL0902 TaxID=1115757 RepID=UPI0018E77FE1|nr:DUF5357 family protein [Leptolyngbya sp. BL0902]QQE63375.1 hypothetical protein GFS31_00400 [Leptolyngbya sp. BL0902]
MIPPLRPYVASLKTTLWPKSAFSWLTVIYMSLISWLMSGLSRLLGASPFTVGLMATLAWIFLALGVGWAFEAQKIRPFGLSIAPWVAGGILCLFLFGSWGGAWLQPALITWPLMSFVVVAVPHLLSWELQLKQPPPATRQQLALLLGISLLLSSWFQFYFRIQTWLRDYPSLIADQFDRSAFVYQVPGQAMPLSAGVSHLTQAEFWVKEQIDSKPWSWVERWLLNLQGHQQTLQRQIQVAQPATPESQLWQIRLHTATQGNGYLLRMQAVWLGPSAASDGYYFEKVCEIMPVAQPTAYGTPDATGSGTSWTQVRCQLETPLRHGRP